MGSASRLAELWLRQTPHQLALSIPAGTPAAMLFVVVEQSLGCMQLPPL